MDDALRNNNITYDALAKEYDQKSLVRKDFNSKLISRFIKYIKTGDEVLDLGCAVGLDLEIFKEKGFIPMGIELSSEMVKIAQNRNPKIEIINSDFLKIKIKKRFDAIWVQSFIHLFSKIKANKVLKKIESHLKDDGVIHITTTKSKKSREGWAEKKDYFGKYKRFRKFWTKEEMEKFLQTAGFSIVDYYEIEDPFNKIHMNFTVRKSK